MRKYLMPVGMLGTGGWIVSSGAVLSLTGAASAAGTATLSLNTTTLLPSTAGQSLILDITGTSGTTAIEGSDVYAQINNGSAGGNPPILGNITMTSAGEVFAGFSQGTTATSGNWIAANDATTESGSVSVPDTGELAILTISTVGMSSGSFTIQFHTIDGNTDVIDSVGPSDITLSGAGNLSGANIEGTITLAVPEPTSAALLCTGTTGILMRRRRRSA